MVAADIMTETPRVLSPDETVAAAVDLLQEVEARHLPQRVDPGVGASCGVQRRPLAGNCEYRIFDRALHGGRVLLSLQAGKGPTVEFKREGEPCHPTRVPAGIGLPRRNASRSIAGLPARWTRIGRSAA